MSNIIRTLSIALSFGLFLNVAQPARADFFPEPFATDSAARPVQTVNAPQATTERAYLQINTNASSKSEDADAWSVPLLNPTPYVPMSAIKPQSAVVVAPASAPIAVPSHATGTIDGWSTPTSNPTPYAPMR